MVRGFTVLLCLLLALNLQAQKVALVLSGGGSRGLAHVGVLKALEDNKVPIDCIAGTSMGAIVGGLYASGFSPDEIEAFVTSADFERWIRGELEEDHIYYFKKPDPNASWVSLKFDFNDLSGKLETRLPTNLISPYQMDFAILEFYSSASATARYDFDSLFVPFRCVAADIDSNLYVVLDSGQLGTAIRASATYPFYFKPVEINDKLLFDGGIYNNFPVDVAIDEFQPDVIIGSRASSEIRKPEKDDLFSQVMNMIVNETEYYFPEDSGILINTNLPAVNVIDFSRSREFIDSGYTAAMRNMDNILQLVRKRADDMQLAEKRYRFNKSKPPLIVDSIDIQGLSRSQSAYIRKLLQKRSRYVNLESVKSEYFKLLGDNKIKNVFPTLVYSPERHFYTLQLQVERAEHFMTEFGGNISSSAANAAFISLEYRLLSSIGLTASVNGYFGRFYSSAKAEIRMDFPSYFPYFISLEYTYNHKDYFRNTTYFFEDKTPTFLLQNENHFGLNAGIPAGKAGKLKAGAYLGYTLDEYYQDNYFTREDTADITRLNFRNYQINYENNSLNKKQLATSGSLLYFSFQYTSGREMTIPGSTASFSGVNIEKDHRWLQLRLVFDRYFHPVSWLTLGLYGELVLSDISEFSNYTATVLRAPAFSPIPEMKTLFLPKYRAPVYAAVGLKMLLPVYRNLFFRTEAYYFQPYQELAAGENMETVYRKPWSDHSFAGTAGLEYHTPFGPISLSMNYYDRADDKLSVLFNIGFLLFNKSVFD
jgi:NTE family protein